MSHSSQLLIWSFVARCGVAPLLLICVLLSWAVVGCQAQTIPVSINGDITNVPIALPPSNTWDCDRRGGRFEVSNGTILINDAEGKPCCSCTGPLGTDLDCGSNTALATLFINTLGLCDIQISVDTRAQGPMECINNVFAPGCAADQGEGQDYLGVQANGVTLGSYCGLQSRGSFTANLGSVNGINMQIMGGTQAQDEIYSISNIRITAKQRPIVLSLASNQGDNQYCIGDVMVLTASTVLPPGGTFTFHWYRDNTLVETTSTPILTMPIMDNSLAGTYRVEIEHPDYCTTSSNEVAIAIEVCQRDPIFNDLPKTLCAGDTLALPSVDNTGLVTGGWNTPSPILLEDVGVYDFSFRYNGPNSPYEYTVEVFESYDTTIIWTACEGDTAPVDQQLMASNACDSIIRYQVQYFPRSIDTVVFERCIGDGFSHMVNGEVFDEQNPTGIVDVGMDNQYGCDSLLYVQINYRQVLRDTQRVVLACESDSLTAFWEVGDSRYDYFNRSGSDTFQRENGCDSIVFTNISFYENSQTALDTVICEGDTLEIGAISITSGEQIDDHNPVILSNQNGCDSIIDISGVQFLTAQYTLLEFSFCAGEDTSLVVNGRAYNRNNPTGREILSAQSGCDSIVEVALHYIQPYFQSDTLSSCSGSGFALRVGQSIYTEANPEGYDTLQSMMGCDSIIHTVILYESIKVGYIDTLLCGDDSINIVGFSYTRDDVLAGRLEDSVLLTNSAQSGCDSLLVIRNMDNWYSGNTTEINYDGCAGDSYIFQLDDLVFDENNPVGRIERQIAGRCPDVFAIDLRYKPNAQDTLQRMICNEDSTFQVQVGTDIYDINNPQGETVLRASNGCDSTVFVDIDFIQPNTRTIDTTLCPGEQLVVAGVIFDENLTDSIIRTTHADSCSNRIAVEVQFYERGSLAIDSQGVGENVYWLSLTSPSPYQDPVWYNSSGEIVGDNQDTLLVRLEQAEQIVVDAIDSNFCTIMSSINLPFTSPPTEVPTGRGGYYMPSVVRLNPASRSNQGFYPQLAEGIEGNYDLYIYDRWGALHYQVERAPANTPSDIWMRDNGEEIGVYHYYIRIRIDNSDTVIEDTGQVTLVR